MVIVYRLYMCPRCRCRYDMNFFGLSSHLGPKTIVCRKCAQPHQTHREEWPQKTIKAKLSLVLITLVYIVIGGLGGGNLLYGAIRIWQGQPDVPDLPLHHPACQKLVILSGFFICALMLLKIHQSTSRASQLNSHVQTSSENFLSLNFTFGAQIKTMFLFLLPWLIAYARFK